MELGTTLGLLTATLMIAGTAGASTLTLHATYEITPFTMTGLVDTQPDPVGVTPDGYWDLNGVLFSCPQVQGSYVVVEDSNHDGCGTWNELQAMIVDDVWGSNAVFGMVCVDGNGDFICEDTPAEPKSFFCGTSPVIDFEPYEEGSITVWLGGTTGQAMYCDPGDAPTGAETGGILNPAGGVYITLTEA